MVPTSPCSAPVEPGEAGASAVHVDADKDQDMCASNGGEELSSPGPCLLHCRRLEAVVSRSLGHSRWLGI